MITEVYQICNAYESGIGHGIKEDGHSNTSFGSSELGVKLTEAYSIGYAEGRSKQLKTKKTILHEMLEGILKELDKVSSPPATLSKVDAFGKKFIEKNLFL